MKKINNNFLIILIMFTFLTNVKYSNVNDGISTQGKQFLSDLYWNIPLNTDPITVFNLLSEKNNIFYDISKSGLASTIMAEAYNNKYIDASLSRWKYMTLYVYFDDKMKSKGKMISIHGCTSYSILNTMTFLIESISAKNTSTTCNKEVLFDEAYKYEYFAATTSTTPFFTIISQIEHDSKDKTKIVEAKYQFWLDETALVFSK
ncbi:MAG TPA: hypothetical protein PKK00_08910 [Bacteroidales bacterium]|nr:hypothetical protein [Bacteroidales bacterium]HPS17331.1 hypothetical protein [Bacteroidales bacterium]